MCRSRSSASDSRSSARRWRAWPAPPSWSPRPSSRSHRCSRGRRRAGSRPAFPCAPWRPAGSTRRRRGGRAPRRPTGRPGRRRASSAADVLGRARSAPCRRRRSARRRTPCQIRRVRVEQAGTQVGLPGRQRRGDDLRVDGAEIARLMRRSRRSPCRPGRRARARRASRSRARAAPGRRTRPWLYVFTGSRFSTRVHWPSANAVSRPITACAFAAAAPGRVRQLEEPPQVRLVALPRGLELRLVGDQVVVAIGQTEPALDDLRHVARRPRANPARSPCRSAWRRRAGRDDPSRRRSGAATASASIAASSPASGARPARSTAASSMKLSYRSPMRRSSALARAFAAASTRPRNWTSILSCKVWNEPM